MELGLGVLQISPHEFWNMSFTEFYNALQGFKEFHCSKQNEPLTKSELDELMEMYPD